MPRLGVGGDTCDARVLEVVGTEDGAGNGAGTGTEVLPSGVSLDAADVVDVCGGGAGAGRTGTALDGSSMTA